MKNKTIKKKLGRPAIYTPEEARLRKKSKAKEYYANFTPEKKLRNTFSSYMSLALKERFATPEELEEKKLWKIFSGYMSAALNKQLATPEELEAIIKKKQRNDRNYYNGPKRKEQSHPSTKEAWAYKAVGKTLTRHNQLIERGKISKDSKFDVTLEWILKRLNEQNLRCIETDVEFTFGTAKCPFKPSLDRIDNKKGYEKSNLRIVTVQANISRRDFTIDRHQENIVRAAEVFKRNNPEQYKIYASLIESK